MSIVGMRKNMQSWFKYVMIGLAIVFAVGVIGIGVGSGRFRDQEGSQEGVLAKVNGEEIDWRTFEQRFLDMVDRIEETRLLGAFEAAQLRGNMFDGVVNQMLQVQAAKAESIKVSRRDVKTKINEKVEEQLKQIKDELLAGHKGEKTDKAFEAELKRRELTIGKLRSDIRKGIDADRTRQEVMIEKLNEKLGNSIDASDEAVRKSYDEVRFSQITVGTKKRSEVQAKQRAAELVGRLNKGADFASLAKEHSEDPYRAAGGDRGYFTRRAYLEDELASAVFKLKPGEVSSLVKTSQGFVIAKVDSRRSSLPADYDDAKKKKEYKEAYLAQEQYGVRAKYFDALQKKAKIEVYDPELKGYLLVKELSPMLGASDSAPLKAKVEEAIKEYRRALIDAKGTSNPTARAYAMIAYLYDGLRRPGPFSPSKEEQVKFRAEAKKALLDALDYCESNDLRMMLADINIEEGEYDKALEHLEIVSENAFQDYAIHAQLVGKYEQMKRSPEVATLIAQERKWLDDYNRQMSEQREAEMPKAPPKTTPGSEKEKTGG